MKKTLLLAILLMPTLAFATIDSNLKYGSRGVEVTELQEFLIDKGFLTGQPTGNFFALTKKAVIAYQKSLNLPATGFVGQLTRAEINKELEVNNEAEIQETGAVNQPVSNNVDDLLKKIADLTEQQKAQQEQTNRLIESIKPEPKVSGVISIPQPVEIVTPSYVTGKGGNCGGVQLQLKVKYDNGKYKMGDQITIYYPDGTSNNIKSNGPNSGEFVDDNGWGSFYTVWHTPLISTTTKILVVKDNLKKEIDVEVTPLIVPMHNLRKEGNYGPRANKYIYVNTSDTYNPETYMCQY